MSNKKLHRHTKQSDAEQLAIGLQTCCAYANSALTEEGITLSVNEYYYRVVEHYMEIDEAKPADLENVAKCLDVLAEQFRIIAENVREENPDNDDDDKRMQAREDESRKETL